MKFKGNSQEYLQLVNITSENCSILKETIEGSLTVLWFEADGSQLIIDGKTYSFDKDQIVFLTEFHKVQVVKVTQIRLVRFNRSFYCILDHDGEVGCKGILFFGASQ